VIHAKHASASRVDGLSKLSVAPSKKILTEGTAF
jgi:hypothetical protein